MAYQAGWYKSKQGNPFHALGHNMSDETLEAVGAIADSVRESLSHHCPVCDNAWLHGMEFDGDNRRYKCDCGWTGTRDQVSVHEPRNKGD